MNKNTLSTPWPIIIIASILGIISMGCTDLPQGGVDDIPGVQKVDELFSKYRRIRAESPDQLTILLQRQEPEVFHGLITKPIENAKVQMHLVTRGLLEEDIYAECVLADPAQVVEAKVGEHVTLAGRLSEFADHQLKFIGCQILENHSQ